MLKLKKLINESTPGFTKRKFGDPLPTLEDVMKQHQESKLQEDWWDDLDRADQPTYTKSHSTRQKVQDAKVDDGAEITVNGKQYRSITESKKSSYNFTELHDRIINRRI
jgi:hypothetical protein